jgi:hypothetical protein
VDAEAAIAAGAAADDAAAALASAAEAEAAAAAADAEAAASSASAMASCIDCVPVNKSTKGELQNRSQDDDENLAPKQLQAPPVGPWNQIVRHEQRTRKNQI